MSDSVRPQRRQPIRLPHPWDAPGKNTGVGCHFLLQCMKVKSEREVSQSCLTLRDPMDCSLPGSSVHGIFQARVLEWGAIAFFDKTWCSQINRQIFLKYFDNCILCDGFVMGFLYLLRGLLLCFLIFIYLSALGLSWNMILCPLD